MNITENINSSALYSPNYTGSAKRTMDSQEQYEALLNDWGFSSDSSKQEFALFKNVSTFISKTAQAVKSGYTFATTLVLFSKRHIANAHFFSH